jgi:TRAP-type mannitol/chloroaromatic compound transport system substrate-binding protein
MPDITVRALPDDVSVAIAETSAEVLADLSSEDDITRRVHESYMSFRERAMAYTQVSEYGYARARMLEQLKQS